MWPPQRRIGQLLGGKYRVQQLLALGGMGVIYSACHELTGRSVAIKALRPELATRSDLLRRVSVEARLAVEASHPNVVEVLDAGVDDLGIPYVVLERLYGKPLEALISQRLPLLATAQTLLPVMNALVALHGASIVHRDIKPSNIFLSCEADRVVPKLLDFGIAKALVSADSTLSNVALGTPFYMAPEQALGCLKLGPATDVWSMAVVFVRCLTGRLPFEALPEKGPSASTFALHAGQLEHVPEPIGRVLARALRLDPSDRFASMADLRTALLEALQQIDSRERWPSEATVAYSIDEFSLAFTSTALDTDALEDSTPSRQHLAARPANAFTRTLARMRPTSGPRRTRLALIASLGLVGAASLPFLRQSSSRRGPESSDHAPPVFAATAEGGTGVADLERPETVPDALHARTSAMPGPIGAEPLVTPSAVALDSKAVVAQQKLRRSTPRSAGEKPVAEAPQASVPLGPNRSPIIE